MRGSRLIIGGLISAWLGLQGCIFVVSEQPGEKGDSLMATDSSKALPFMDSAIHPLQDTAVANRLVLPKGGIDTKNLTPQQLIEFAKTLIGTPYKYGSTNPEAGFDCSGFITYVFSHFDIVVPRSSIDFTNIGKEVSVTEAKPGDLILFTGTNSEEKFVGHMGIIVSHQNHEVAFIHSTSGKAYGVTITPLNEGYKKRYVKTIRIFPENGT